MSREEKIIETSYEQLGLVFSVSDLFHMQQLAKYRKQGFKFIFSDMTLNLSFA